MNGKRGPKQWSRPRRILFLAGLVGAGIGAFIVIEAVFTPWARSLTGEPTLTGEWLGEMTTATGRKHAVWLQLQHRIPTGRSSCSNCSRIEGIVRTCTSGAMRAYRLWGDVENWRGTQFRVRTQEEQEYAGEPVLGALQGTWSGDTVELSTHLIVRGATQTVRLEIDERGNETQTILGGHPDRRAAITWRMHRGAQHDFEKRCTSASHNSSTTPRVN